MTTEKRGRGRPRTKPAAEDADNIEETSPHERFQRLLEEFGGNEAIRVKLMRRTVDNLRWAHVTSSLQLTESVMDEIQARYGGGTYQATFLDGRKFMKGRSIEFELEGKRIIPNVVIGEDQGEASRLDRLEAAILKLTEKPVSGGGLSDAKDLLGFAMQFLGKNQGGSVDPLLLQTAITAAEERGENRGKTIGKLEATVELGGTGSGEGVAAALKAYQPFFMTLAQRLGNRAPAVVPAANPPLSSGPPDAPIPAPHPIVQSDDTMNLNPVYLWLIPLRAYYPQLKVQETTDPQICASFVLQQFSDVQLEPIGRCSEREDFLTVVTDDLVTRGQIARPWAEAFVKEIRESFEEEEPS